MGSGVNSKKVGKVELNFLFRPFSDIFSPADDSSKRQTTIMYTDNVGPLMFVATYADNAGPLMFVATFFSGNFTCVVYR